MTGRRTARAAPDPHDVWERAARRYAEGATLRQIAAELGLATGSSDGGSKAVWRGLRGRAAGRRTGPAGRTDVTDEQILEARDALDLSWAEIADTVGMSRSGVRARYLRATTGQRWR